MMDDNVIVLHPEKDDRPVVVVQDNPLPPDSGGPTSGGMDAVWKKLEDHDKRFDRIEKTLDDVSKELSNAKFWFVGTALAIALGGLGLVYAAMSDTKSTMGAALSAIQTVISERPPAGPTTPPQPIVITIPQQHVRPITPR